METATLTTSQRLDPQRLLDAAAATTGLSDFGDNHFREGLQQFVSSVIHDATLNDVGVAVLESHVNGLLVNRLRFVDDVCRHPEILEEEILPPLVIIGLPRTGSTKLHRMVAVDPRFQALRAWQTLNPAPFPEPPDESGKDPRIAVAKQLDAAAAAVSPELLAGHPIQAEEVDEESSYLMEMNFEWILLAIRAYAPSYQAWLKTRSAVPTYQYLRQLLQYLQWQNREPKRPYVLKSTLHLEYLDALLEVFPDATIVHSHRDPAESAASFMRLTEISRTMLYGDVDLDAVGQWVLSTFSDQVREYLGHRDRLAGRTEIVDIAFRDVVRDAPAAIRQAYAPLGWTLSDETCQAMLDWEKGHPKDRFGKFNYALADYGLTRDDVDAAFSDYLTRFGALL